MILLLADGVSYQKIQDLLDTTAPTIARWKERFLKHRIGGLMEERHPGQKPSVRTPKLQAKVLAAIKEGPKDGSTHWSCRKLAEKFKVSKDTVQRILAQADVRPHRLERYMASDDPDFEAKAADVSVASAGDAGRFFGRWNACNSSASLRRGRRTGRCLSYQVGASRSIATAGGRRSAARSGRYFAALPGRGSLIWAGHVRRV